MVKPGESCGAGFTKSYPLYQWPGTTEGCSDGTKVSVGACGSTGTTVPASNTVDLYNWKGG